ncbi:hypothetical protein LCGC14_1081480 [marine sediment metagenome]|uniref:Uncharacterized protein n=1 Tax=marine sediment metagenome TaxID=412755 RepID=A0A0F9MF75_9ZZZZ
MDPPWQHFPGGDDFLHPPPCSIFGVELEIIVDEAAPPGMPTMFIKTNKERDLNAIFITRILTYGGEMPSSHNLNVNAILTKVKTKRPAVTCEAFDLNARVKKLRFTITAKSVQPFSSTISTM